MGYDMEIVVLKKKSLEEIQKVLPDYSFREMYTDFLFSRLYQDEYEVPENEEGRWITSTNINIFRDFFDQKLGNDEAIIINEDTYNKMVAWLEEKLKSKTLHDLACNEDFDKNKLEEMIKIYRQMKEEKINYETEFVVHQHDW